MPSEPLRPYISSFYMMDVRLGPDERIEDWLLPEWASLRMAQSGGCLAGIVPEQPQPRRGMMASGPTSFATRISIGSARIWGIGVLPLGWAKFISAPAAKFADRISDVAHEPAWSKLTPVFDLASLTALPRRWRQLGSKVIFRSCSLQARRLKTKSGSGPRTAC